ncbi:HAD family hydrolase [Natronomonas sp. LN261]|uniref:HAD family hydrolase n=1 Tax=Natronomonas sp. LN261 TaxID=2750669 RepID=UPI0015EE3A60|nr:HAD family hydrolase [Natronomonas sp. LN261]
MNYDTVVLDMDGVVIEPTDSEVIQESILATFEEFGVSSPPPALVDRLLDQQVPADALRNQHDIDPATFWRRRERNSARAQVEVTQYGKKSPYNDVSVLGEFPAELGLVSNNQRMTVEFVVDHFDLDVFETVYGREPTLTGAKRKKPNPYYLN